MRFRLVAFADESAPDLAGQIETIQENGVELLEIRGVDGQNIDGISATKAKVIQKMLGFSGLAVWSLGSPFGKIGINDDPAKEYRGMPNNSMVYRSLLYRIRSFFRQCRGIHPM